MLYSHIDENASPFRSLMFNVHSVKQMMLDVRLITSTPKEEFSLNVAFRAVAQV